MSFTRIRSTGFWTFYSVFLPEEAEELDSRWPDVIDGGAGGIWAPSSVIQIAGSGMTISGPSTFSDIESAIVTSGGQIVIQSGGAAAVNFGATLTNYGNINCNNSGGGGNINLLTGTEIEVASGAQIDVAGLVNIKASASLTMQSSGTATFNGGSTFNCYSTNTFATGVSTFNNGLTLGTSTWLTLSPARSWNRTSWFIKVAGVTSSNAAKCIFVGTIPRLFTYAETVPGTVTLVEFPDMPEAATIATVKVLSQGLAGATNLTVPHYKVVRWTSSTGLEDMSADTTDGHTTINWTTDVVQTTITINANATIDRRYSYGVYIYHPYSDDGASGYFYEFLAEGTTTTMRV